MTLTGRAGRWALALTLVALPPPVLAARLDIELTGVENDHGLVRVAVRTPETFTTKHYPFFRSAPAKTGSVIVSVEGIPPARYAVQAYHDEDGNGRLRKSLFGIPAEAIGFSRDARVRLGTPSFEEAAIEVAEPVTATRLRLRHLGPSPPLNLPTSEPHRTKPHGPDNKTGAEQGARSDPWLLGH